MEITMKVSEFTAENPLDTEVIFEKFGIDPIVIALGHKYHRVEVRAKYGAKTEDAPTIGQNFIDRQSAEESFKKRGIEFKFDPSQNDRAVTLQLKIILNDDPMPYDDGENELYDIFHQDSIKVVRFILLLMSYKHEEITKATILDKGFDLQSYWLPPLRSSNANILGISVTTNEPILPFAWGRPMTPPVQVPSPSPTPSLMQMNSNLSKKSEKNAPPPSMAVPPKMTSSLPHRKDEVDEEGFTRVRDGIAKFEDYFIRGKERVIPDEQIYKAYTQRVNEKHHTVAGRGVSDLLFREEMEKKLGPKHFPIWEKIFPL